MKHDRRISGRHAPKGHEHAGQQLASTSKRSKRAMTVQQALEWAFGKEAAQLELPEPQVSDRGPGFGFGLEYVLIQRATLGCKIDGGRYKQGSYTHEDAEVIAAIVSALPDDLGGKRMAIRIAELARAGLTPDWMPGAVPHCLPVEMKRNRYGDHAATMVVGTERVLLRGKWRTIEVRACPVTYHPHPDQIADARRAYTTWRKALGWIRDGLQAGSIMREITVVSGLPKGRPWS